MILIPLLLLVKTDESIFLNNNLTICSYLRYRQGYCLNICVCICVYTRMFWRRKPLVPGSTTDSQRGSNPSSMITLVWCCTAFAMRILGWQTIIAWATKHAGMTDPSHMSYQGSWDDKPPLRELLWILGEMPLLNELLGSLGWQAPLE